MAIGNVLLISVIFVLVWALLPIFQILKPGLQPQQDAPLFTWTKYDAIWTGGLTVGHGNLSMADFIPICRSHPFRWAAVVPWLNHLILASKPLDSYAQYRVRHCVEPSEGLSARPYVRHAASHGFRKNVFLLFYYPSSFFLLHSLGINLVKVHNYFLFKFHRIPYLWFFVSL